MNQNVKTALVVGGVIIALIVVLPWVFGLISGGQGYGYGMMGSGMMGNFGWGWFMPILWIVFLGLTIWAVAVGIRGVSEPRSSDSLKGDSALEMLKKRYARGEINKEEYEEKKKDLA